MRPIAGLLRPTRPSVQCGARAGQLLPEEGDGERAAGGIRLDPVRGDRIAEPLEERHRVGRAPAASLSKPDWCARASTSASSRRPMPKRGWRTKIGPMRAATPSASRLGASRPCRPARRRARRRTRSSFMRDRVIVRRVDEPGSKAATCSLRQHVRRSARISGSRAGSAGLGKSSMPIGAAQELRDRRTRHRRLIRRIRVHARLDHRRAGRVPSGRRAPTLARVRRRAVEPRGRRCRPGRFGLLVGRRPAAACTRLPCTSSPARTPCGSGRPIFRLV